MEEAVGIVERHFGIALVRVKDDEWRSISGCPQCGDGGKGHNSDRFRLLLNGPSNPRVWCRKCGYIAFVDALDSARPLSEEDKMKLRMAAIERRQEEQQRQMDALQRMLTCQDHLLYHKNTMNGEGLEYWWEEGIQTAQVRQGDADFPERVQVVRPAVQPDLQQFAMLLDDEILLERIVKSYIDAERIAAGYRC